jgi:hypothetical protein
MIKSFSTFYTIFFLFLLNITLKAQTTDQNILSEPVSMVIKPDWQHGLELIYKLNRTNLVTNERDMPMSIDVDSFYTQLNVFHVGDNILISIVNFTKYDKPSKTPYLESNEFLFHDTLWLEFDSSFVFKGLKNWEKWKGYLFRSIKMDLDSGLINLKTYSEMRKIYADRNVVEEIVLLPYIDFISMLGKRIVLWERMPFTMKLENPYTKKLEEHSTFDFYYYLADNPNHLLRNVIVETDEKDYSRLANDYKNYLKATSASGTNVELPDPRIKLRKHIYQFFNVHTFQFDYYRSEQYVDVNGAKEYIEYIMDLIYIRKPEAILKK